VNAMARLTGGPQAPKNTGYGVARYKAESTGRIDSSSELLATNG
jgi:hypothetical protein